MKPRFPGEIFEGGHDDIPPAVRHRLLPEIRLVRDDRSDKHPDDQFPDLARDYLLVCPNVLVALLLDAPLILANDRAGENLIVRHPACRGDVVHLDHNLALYLHTWRRGCHRMTSAPKLARRPSPNPNQSLVQRLNCSC